MGENRDNGFLIKQIHERLEKRANNSLRENDLTMMQVSVLLVLQKAEGQCLSMKALERHFGVAQSTVAGIIARLEQKHFVEARGDAADKRVKLVHITPAGEQCCMDAAHNMAEAEENILRGFSEDERRLFNALLAKAADNLK